MRHRSHAAWSGLSAGFCRLTKVTMAASPSGPVRASPVSLARESRVDWYPGPKLCMVARMAGMNRLLYAGKSC